jgi:queuine tRNA-ribosyltransferase
VIHIEARETFLGFFEIIGILVPMFELSKSTALGRSGTLKTAHGDLQTPFFMPVGTCGAMKGLSHTDLLELGAELLLCNTYHLHIQPGENVVKDAGGLHEFIGWEKPILTDSGGYQVFSLRTISKISDKGVDFRNHRSGDPLFIGPEESMTIQHKLGSDIIMCFDECIPSTASRAEHQIATDRTLRWAKECKKVHDALNAKKQKKVLLFGIVQGGLERDLREKCAAELAAIGFDGYAVGGLAVGESEAEMYDVLSAVCPCLPENHPRYLMGVGRVEQMKTAVAKGIDMFDCVLPMREARHGSIHMSDGSSIRILNAQYKDDHSPIDPDSPSALGRTHKKSYLHHLLRAGERYGETIACAQNLGTTLAAIKKLRSQIIAA